MIVIRISICSLGYFSYFGVILVSSIIYLWLQYYFPVASFSSIVGVLQDSLRREFLFFYQIVGSAISVLSLSIMLL
jgi:hypothetical protein